MKFYISSLAVISFLFLAPQVNAVCTKNYTSVTGDTCSKIWKKFGLSKLQFNGLNPNIDCSSLKSKSQVCIAGTPGCKSYYEVVSGDRCEKIAAKHNVSLPKFLEDNPRLNCVNIAIGDVMCIGYGEGDLPRIDVPDQKCTKKGTFAITYDDGPYNYTEQLLDYLEAHELKATFFINGASRGNIYNFNSTLKRMYHEGHQIAHHTWSHKDLTTLTEAQIHDEISMLEVALREIIGVVPTFFRPPYGSTNLKVLQILQKHGYRVIKWDVLNDDSINLVNATTLEQAKTAFNTSLANTGIHPTTDGHISLSHDVQEMTVKQFTPWVFDHVKSLGYKTQTVGKCLGVSRLNWYRK